SRRLLRQQAYRRHHRCLARRAALLRLEGVGLHRQRRVRSLLRCPVHAGAEPHGDRGMRGDSAVRDYPKIVVPPPGPKAQAVVRRDQAWTSACYIKEYPLVVDRGRGAMVQDVDGNRFLDFMAGIAVSATGYGHPKVVAAVKEAADRFLHICGSDFYYEGMANLCERLARVAPGPSKKRVFLTNSGTEATEAAIKLA